MYTTVAPPKASVLPYWKEIQKMSREDRSVLAELIESSLEEETQKQDIDNFLSGLDEDLMRRAAKCAHRQYTEGLCIPHTEVMSRIKEEMGWK